MSLPDVIYFADIINSYLPEPNASLVNGIVLGLPLKDDFEFYETVKRTGLLHIVVLSGMNITILAVLIAKATARLSKNISLLLLTILVAIFVGIVGPQAPIMRAVIMCYVTIVAFYFQRSVAPIVCLFMSAITIGLIWPEWITSLSFLLSFFCTLGIIIFAGQTSSSSHAGGQLSQLARSDLKTSLSAQLMTAPLVMIYFKEMSLIAPISTLIVGPFIGPIMLLTFLTMMLGSINWLLGFVPAMIVYGLSEIMVIVISVLSKIPGVFIKF